MEDKIKEVIRELFENAPDSEEIKELQEEMISNALEKYEDLIQRGFTEEQSYTMVMASIGDIKELLAELGADAGTDEEQDDKKSEFWEKQSEYWKWQGEYFEEQAKNLGQEAKKFEEQAKNAFNSFIGSDFFENLSNTFKQIIGNMGESFQNDKGEYSDKQLYNERRFSTDGVTSLSFELQSSPVDLDVQLTKDNEILIQELYTREPEKDQMLEYTVSGTQLKVGYPMNVIGIARKGTVRVFLPEDFAGTVEEFKAYTASGDVTLEDLGAAKQTIRTVSGNIKGKYASGEISLNTVSGDVSFDSMENQIKIKTASGDISIGKAVGNVNFGSASGDIDIDELEGNASIKTASGDVELKVTKAGEKLEVCTASGDVDIELPEQGAVRMTLNTASGDISTFCDHIETEEHVDYVRNGKHAVGTIGEEPFLDVKVNTASGDIDISR